jgi:hypothetical protein
MSLKIGITTPLFLASGGATLVAAHMVQALETDYDLDPAYSGLAGTRRRPCLSSRRAIFGGLSLTSLLVR